jgi:hypothetical protein
VGDYFADTSALAKRYLEEDGSEWLSDICSDKDNVITSRRSPGLSCSRRSLEGEKAG